MSGKIKDLTGNTYNKLKIVSFSRIHNKRAYWNCECTCGNLIEVGGNSLTTGNTKTCGCAAKEANLMHGDTKTGPYKKLYMVWCALKQRCTNPKYKQYSYYGGRGITLISEWHTYTLFKEWAINAGYVLGLEIDRINNKLGYYPENCRWVNRSINTRNRRANLKGTSSYVGVSFCNTLNMWVATLGINGKNITIGRFKSEISAAKARDYYVKSNNLEDYTININ